MYLRQLLVTYMMYLRQLLVIISKKITTKTTTISGRDVLYTTLCDKVGQ
jgi:hypothetical protein